ncbi:porphobilinogen deaminase [Clostridium pasteurianum DSM 525 = ATCC 6013]|uniref:Porphobilinogen deaminase n=1 Tax=Clostridium pasteurianum DSM 525 = ATCC 6013 TaxID=1262449 RepID=A0A0H3JAI5_CLOPA|nr:hydroxymethylbilane synthase [Clostridium pasteurianum]AJA49578.1 porphobilinogen deaminase [Clostridium pasteurianum DSM 525 = ATCC 6013]AJA53566.1 porphobilinogen deaminase [Clostridium pasteurianum DSM 525 = ATCC 6013]AOZ76732.1 porphobilinogen deaminase [Clostridium pasteurianum DSM 525 = ATCC 6013]AOZ80529.1 porphobilinogen deaminase [Clostridium pasteurianum]ELP58906.1 porphobilinogen deaminase [Clostridium pasteurianum DSM 525 = ATCC 6013]
MKSKIIIGTRGSKLALTQTNMVIEAIKRCYPDIIVEIKKIKTTGDKILDKSLSKIGGKGLFIAEIEKALKNYDIDLAIHSMKDVQNIVSEEFEILSVLRREDPRDALITKDKISLLELQKGAIIGTSSLRRMVQIKNIRPDLQFKPLRGNIDTRINKMLKGEVDGIILAAAGLKRMDWGDSISEYIDIHKCIPSVGQGALCAELRNNDVEIKEIVNSLVNEIEFKCLLAERSFLKEMNGGCSIAIGAHAVQYNNKIELEGFVADDNNISIFKNNVIGYLDEYENIGTNLAKKIMEMKGDR